MGFTRCRRWRPGVAPSLPWSFRPEASGEPAGVEAPLGSAGDVSSLELELELLLSPELEDSPGKGKASPEDFFAGERLGASGACGMPLILGAGASGVGAPSPGNGNFSVELGLAG
jgi:hypothetical protein